MRFGRQDYNRRIVDLEGKIPDDEPVFLLRGQDVLAPKLLLMWAADLRLSGGDPQMARETEELAQEMIMWQRNNLGKTPDRLIESDSKKSIRDRIFSEIEKIDKKESTLTLKDFYDLLDAYFDGYQNYYTVLPVDMKESSLKLPLDLISMSDVDIDNLSPKELQDMMSKKVIIAVRSDSEFKVIKIDI